MPMYLAPPWFSVELWHFVEEGDGGGSGVGLDISRNINPSSLACITHLFIQ